jgi:hypothetical protein
LQYFSFENRDFTQLAKHHYVYNTAVFENTASKTAEKLCSQTPPYMCGYPSNIEYPTMDPGIGVGLYPYTGTGIETGIKYSMGVYVCNCTHTAQDAAAALRMVHVCGGAQTTRLWLYPPSLRPTCHVSSLLVRGPGTVGKVATKKDTFFLER